MIRLNVDLFKNMMTAKIASWKLLEQKITHFYDIARWIHLAIIYPPAQKICIFAIFVLLFLLIKVQMKYLVFVFIHESERIKEREKN